MEDDEELEEVFETVFSKMLPCSSSEETNIFSEKELEKIQPTIYNISQNSSFMNQHTAFGILRKNKNFYRLVGLVCKIYLEATHEKEFKRFEFDLAADLLEEDEKE